MLRSIMLLFCLVARQAHSTGARDWEVKNSLLHQAGVLNDAQLGLANWQQAMHDPSLLADVTRGLRSQEGRAELIKMMANPSFQQQIKVLMEGSGTASSGSPQTLANLLLSLNPVSARAASMRTGVRMDALGDLKAIAEAQNPAIGFWDPLRFAEGQLWSEKPEGSIAWLRHAEMKHGRVAMAGFVGFCVHENGIRWPFALSYSLPDYSSFEGLSAPAVWDAIPAASKLQILGLIGFFEAWSEWSGRNGQPHYMRGGKPGAFPPLKGVPTGLPNRNMDFPLPLFDPVGITKGFSEEEKARKLNIEINNGRLAMIGLMSLISEAKVPGAVPALAGMIKKYDGQVMGPFSETDDLPLVKEMLKFLLPDAIK